MHRLDNYVNNLCKRFEVKIKPKSFIRSYFQMKHKYYETKYIPNFDIFTPQQMKYSVKNTKHYYNALPPLVTLLPQKLLIYTDI